MTGDHEDEGASRASIWTALRTDDPVTALARLVETWRDAGCTQAVAEARLTLFLLEEVPARGNECDDDSVRDVLDRVVGFCSAPMRLYS